MIGLGIMGSSMAANLMKHGFEVHAWARHPEKTAIQNLTKEGLILHDTLAQACEEVDGVLTIVGFPKDVKSLYLDKGGILDSLKPGSFAVEMTTSDPDLAVRLYKEGKKRGIDVMDAPVTGGDAGARAGTLSILCGAEPELFERVLPVLEAIGTRIRRMGEPGAGQQSKLVNQILIAGAMAGVAEAFGYAKACGLDPQMLYEALKDGAAGSKSLDLYWPRLVRGDLEPGFFIRHFVKDMNLAKNQAARHGLELPVLNLVDQEYQSIGDDSLGTQALAKLYLPQSTD